MNILLLIASFLIIFSTMLYSFAKQSSSAKDKALYFKTFMDLERTALSGIQKSQYRNVVQKKDPKKNSGPKDSSKKPLCVDRDKKPPSDATKLNLSALLQQPRPPFHTHLREIAEELLRRLYANTAVEELAKKLGVINFEHEILEALISKSNADPKLCSLEELYPEDPRLNQIYAKMYAGTKKYAIKPKEGYPPLEDFFYLSQTKQSPVIFGLASTPLLKAVFGEELAERILQEEKARGTEEGPVSLEEPELRAILSKESGKKPTLSDLEGILVFSHQRLRTRVYTLYDEESQISRKVREEKRKRGPEP